MSNVEPRWSPDWATHPGQHLEEYLEAREMSQAELARLTGLTPKLISTVVSGKNPVTPDTALKLERVLGLKADTWLSLQSRFDLHVAQNAESSVPQEFLSLFPIKELVARGVLPAKEKASELGNALLSFLGIGSPGVLATRIEGLCVRHRQSAKAKSSPEHVLSWLLLGETRARKMNVGPFSADKFQFALSEIRKLTVLPPEKFQGRMVELCREAGVALVFEPPISKTFVYGSARWFDNDRALIQMSLRMKFNDHFWWTFFHEAGHIVLHRGKNFADDVTLDGDTFETEANKFAQQLLVPNDSWNSFLSAHPNSKAKVEQFARAIEIHPGIVVGMLQHHGVLKFSDLNGLKNRFDWA